MWWNCHGQRAMFKVLQGSERRLKPTAKECRVTKAPTGYWVFAGYGNADTWTLEDTQSYSTSDTNERSKAWEKEVENSAGTSVTVKSGDGSLGPAVEATVSHGYRELVKNGVTDTLSKTTEKNTEVKSTHEFKKAGSAWQFVVDVKD